MELNSLLLLASAGPAVIYVSPTGSDARSGAAIALAKRTLSGAAKSLPTGGVCVVLPGTYRETVRLAKSGTQGRPIVFRADPKGPVVLSGADPVAGLTPAGPGLFRAPSGPDFTDKKQSDQAFEKGKMIELARWPDNKGNLASPTDAKVVEAKDAGGDLIELKVTPQFDEPDGRWVGAKVWVNLSRLAPNWGQDGQAQTGTVAATNREKGTITVSGIDKRSWADGKYNPDQPWGVGPGTEIHLFDPTPAGVAATGGAAALLSPGEWWVDRAARTFYVKPLSGKAEGIERKRRSFAFDLSDCQNVVVEGFHLFGTSITTDLGADDRSQSVAASRNITLRRLRGRYLTHFTDHTGQFQMMWLQRSGIRLSGIGHVLEDSVFEDIAGPAVSVIGINNKVLGCTIRRANYSASEAGCVDLGRSYDPAATISVDHEIGWNTIEDSPQQGINFRGLINSDPSKPGLARIHHNLIRRVMTRTYDSAAIDQFGTDGKMVRIDHNVIHDMPGSLRIGIYVDFGFNYLIDHNLIWNVDRPIQINHQDPGKACGVRVEWNTALSSPQRFQLPGILNGAGDQNPGSTMLNNITSVRAEFGKGSKIEGNVVATEGLFVNPSSGDYRTIKDLKAGAFEFGKPAWKAGAAAWTGRKR